jgi:Flp pilus assembly protein TadG
MAPVGRRRAFRAGESGAEIIEFALVLPMLLLIVLGIFDFGLLFEHYEVITNAAREGARVAVLPGYSASDAQQRVRDYLTAAGLTQAIDDPAITPGTITVGGGNCVNVTTVTVNYPQTYWLVGGIAAYFGATGLSSMTAITATAQMRNEVPAGGCP